MTEWCISTSRMMKVRARSHATLRPPALDGAPASAGSVELITDICNSSLSMESCRLADD
jgi:hypothetical protein